MAIDLVRQGRRRRCVLYAQPGAGGPALLDHLRSRLSDGPLDVHLLVPVSVPAWSALSLVDPFGGWVGWSASELCAMDHEAQASADRQVAALRGLIWEMGAPWPTASFVAGEDLDGVVATVRVSDPDEVVVATGRTPLWTWRARSIARRLRQSLGLPVRVVTDARLSRWSRFRWPSEGALLFIA